MSPPCLTLEAVQSETGYTETGIRGAAGAAGVQRRRRGLVSIPMYCPGAIELSARNADGIPLATSSTSLPRTRSRITAIGNRPRFCRVRIASIDSQQHVESGGRGRFHESAVLEQFPSAALRADHFMPGKTGRQPPRHAVVQ